MKRAIIIHCWEGYPEYCWYPYVKQELEKNGFKVDVPQFPETELPKLDIWLLKLKEIVGEPDENLFLIGHSIGAVTILRYIESLAEGQKIGGVVLVAGFTDDMGYKEFRNFFVEPLDVEKIRDCAKNYVAIHSDNDPYIPTEYGNIFADKLKAKLIIKHNMKHFSIDCKELPDVVDAILEISK